MAIGKSPKDKLFRGYIDLEIQLREFDRCRILYEKFLEFGPENCTTFMKVSTNFHKNFELTVSTWLSQIWSYLKGMKRFLPLNYSSLSAKGSPLHVNSVIKIQ